jgi:epoxyqueuosine reductase
VARYSWIDHYRPLRAALGAVADELVREGWRAKVVADDNALVDRAAAHRAGLGWFGKNTNLLLHDRGSEFVLGSVVTDAPLPPTAGEPAAHDGCGACARCLPACPTGALVAPGVLDAGRCLAWLVQAEGTFPREHRAALGARIYGCDECQDACPPNRLEIRRRPPQPAEPGAEPAVSLLALLAEDDDDVLLDRYGRWYIARRQARHLRRNALVALGNVADGRDPAVLVVLERCLSDDDPLVRGHAVWAAARVGRADLLAALARSETDPSVRAELAALPEPREA